MELHKVPKAFLLFVEVPVVVLSPHETRPPTRHCGNSLLQTMRTSYVLHKPVSLWMEEEKEKGCV